MSDLYQRLASDPDVENMFPVLTVGYGSHKSIVAHVVDGQVYLTEEGKAYLESKGGKPKPARTQKAAEKPADEAPKNDDELDFS
ncbi:MAG TPA: hypothetical protein PKL28_07290 [Rhodocyclaceae bacterium]|nr:hypothetical protein [Rhodocyclaceae bacterium]